MPRFRRTQPSVARTIRFPKRLRQVTTSDAELCGRSFDSHVIAIPRRHYGEDVDIAPAADAILALARASLSGLTREDLKLLSRKLVEDDEG